MPTTDANWVYRLVGIETLTFDRHAVLDPRSPGGERSILGRPDRARRVGPETPFEGGSPTGSPAIDRFRFPAPTRDRPAGDAALRDAPIRWVDLGKNVQMRITIADRSRVESHW
ncbi:hypothetical protein [Frankia sp. CiP1_Cm_nod2]|uniref:hypothetical protein n=1 Tax=Frankia sp. CiP1_Cm_nod2 TaxID=2897161 RepID=UPI002024050F